MDDTLINASHADEVIKEVLEDRPQMLVVEDDRIIMMVICRHLEAMDIDVVTATNGKEACEKVVKAKGEFDAILVDREMPVMNGIKVVKWLKSNPEYAHIPVIMQTGFDTAEEIKDGIDAGVFYYLTKPIQEEILHSVVLAAIKESEHQKRFHMELKKYGSSFQYMESSKYVISQLEEAETLACFIANCFPDPDRTLPGIAELMINAIEHGNLGITYDKKTELVRDGTWREEIHRRANLAKNKKKVIEVYYKRTPSAYMIKIVDQGKGFEWRKFLQVDPARATDNHGRGIAQANMLSFDSLVYNEKGNIVKATVDANHDELEIDW